MKLTSNEIEAANRAEATALLIREGYRVYRPEADCYGEDLIVRTPKGKFLVVQLKGSLAVDRNKYGSKSIWMLFPSRKFRTDVERKWFLVPHDKLYKLMEHEHGHADCFDGRWRSPTISKSDCLFLAKFELSR
jgi:hypothetical protein